MVSAQPLSRMALMGLGLAVTAGLVAAFAGLGSRWGWWSFRTGFMLLSIGALGG